MCASSDTTASPKGPDPASGQRGERENHVQNVADERLWRKTGGWDGDDSAAAATLAAGFPIYYREKDTPEGCFVKEYPDGRREIGRFERRGGDIVRVK